MELTDKQNNCPYCQRGYFAGKSGWQHAKVFFHISDDGVMESLVDGKYGYCKGLKVCPFCLRPLNRED